ncbi:MAG TPA: SEC-C metal-binding domain-containing protein [Sandaracinaceae bacterium]
MGHAAHFLRRLDRVSDAQVELALTLYRDEALLAEVLRGASLEDGVDRVAISLEHPVDGPFVVVTREGRFVTCLGAGMRVRNLPVLTRQRLDAAASRVQRMRDELERVRRLRESGGDGQAALAFKRMQQQGARFAREDARVLLQMQPLFEKDCLLVLVDLIEALTDSIERLATYRLETPNRLSRKQREVVLAFGQAAWTVAHLVVLSSSNRIREAFARGAAEDPSNAGVVHAIAALTFEWGTLMHAARALWFVARGGKSALSAVKADRRGYTMVHRLYRELALAAFALRSDKLRAEALKALTTRAPDPSEEGWEASRERAAVAYSRLLRSVVLDPAPGELAYLVISRRYAAMMLNDTEEPSPEQCDAIPDDVARIAWFANPTSLYEPRSANVTTHVALGLPSIVGAAAEELFLPAEWAQRLLPSPCVEETAYWLSCYMKQNRYAPSRAPRRVEGKVGRNDPCPCGSGNKYKRCCGRA